jgi:hypothetical protein
MRWFRSALLSVAFVLSLAADEGKVDVVLRPWSTRSLAHYKGHEKETLRERMARFMGMKTRFAIAYKAGYREDLPDEAFPVEGYIGMPLPSPCNWYHSGFLKVMVNGRDVGRTALASLTVAEVGKRGILDLVWHPPTGAVRVRFLALPNDDRLFCEVRVDPTEKNCRLQLDLRCYPSFFTSYHHRKGDRRIITPATEVKEGEKQELGLDANGWAFYEDRVFDPDRGEGVGACAMLVGAADGARIRHAPGGYAVSTHLDFAPGTRTARLVFWDFTGTGNAEALRHLREQAPATRRELAALDFTPTRIAKADFTTLSRDVETAIDEAAKVEGSETLVKQARAWMASLPEESARRGKERGILAEEAMARWLDEYHTFRWQLRLAVLLSRI